MSLEENQPTLGGEQGGGTAPPPAGGEGAGQGGTPPADQGGDNRTLADGGGADKPIAETQPRWREDWRESLAGGDEGFLKHLKRYSSPENYAKAGYEAQQRIRSGQTREPLAENPTPEQVAQFRKDNGIPENADGYKIEPGDGLVFGDADKPMLDAFRAFAHERNWTPQQVNQGAAFVAQLQETNRAQQMEQDRGYREQSGEALREEWGREFKGNINAIRSTFERYGEAGLVDQLMGARGPDGRLMGDNPALLRFLNTVTREINPLATVVPAGGGDPGKSAEAELATLRTMMGDRGSEYWQGPNAEKNQSRYRELLTAVEKSKARG